MGKSFYISTTNIEKTISAADTLAAEAISLDSAKESLEHIFAELKEYWEQSNQDAVVFSENLANDIENLGSYTSCNKDFSRIMTQYAEMQLKTSERVVDYKFN